MSDIDYTSPIYELIVKAYKLGKQNQGNGCLVPLITEAEAITLPKAKVVEAIGEDEIDMVHIKGGSTYAGYIEPKSFNSPDLVKRNNLRHEIKRKLGLESKDNG